MNFEEIKELIEVVEKASISGISIEKSDFSIKIEKVANSIQVSTPVVAQPQQQVLMASPSVQTEQVTVEPKSLKGEFITSPMVGTFYKSPSPDSPAFCSPGKTVSKGNTICVLEAMKIFNELEAEFDCKILEILVSDGQVVEYDMPLFRVEKL